MQNTVGWRYDRLDDAEVRSFLGTPWSNKSDANPPEGDIPRNLLFSSRIPHCGLLGPLVLSSLSLNRLTKNTTCDPEGKIDLFASWVETESKNEIIFKAQKDLKLKDFSQTSPSLWELALVPTFWENLAAESTFRFHREGEINFDIIQCKDGPQMATMNAQ